jgi:esterase/lipase superfamily enzyme
MNREYHRWYSPALGHDMELLIFGHAGARLLVFPTSLARFYEWEDRGMIGALAEHIDNGWIQVYCVDGIDREAWYAWHRHPGDRVWRQTLYDRYLCDEVLPLLRWKNPNPFLMTAGASFGAYHALNFALRHPDLVDRTIAMSGLYDIRRFAGGFYSDNVYLNNPVDYIANEHEPWRLDAMRRMDIILATGRGDPNRGSSEYLSTLMWNKGIGNALRLWDGWAHDWPWWQQMLRQYVSGHD